MDEVDGMAGNEDRGGIPVSATVYMCAMMGCCWLVGADQGHQGISNPNHLYLQ